MSLNIYVISVMSLSIQHAPPKRLWILKDFMSTIIFILRYRKYIKIMDTFLVKKKMKRSDFCQVIFGAKTMTFMLVPEKIRIILAP